MAKARKTLREPCSSLDRVAEAWTEVIQWIQKSYGFICNLEVEPRG